MASDHDEPLSREQVLSAVVQGSSNRAAKLDDALSEGERTKQLALSQEHAMNMKRADLGWFGRWFGGEAHASIVVAFIVIILGFGTAIGLWTAGFRTGHQEFWASEAHVALAAATSALGYVFGRGSKDPVKH